MWFQELVGFAETSRDAVLAGLEVEGETLRSLENGREFGCGSLALASLADLRVQADGARASLPGRLRVRELVGDVRSLHGDAANAGATFQVASQFNVLEMVSPTVTPDAGVDIYEHDHTQGPSCAIACGAATIYRNYFVEVDGGLGQTATRQLDGLADVAELLHVAGDGADPLWTMSNGYALFDEHGLRELNRRLPDPASDAWDDLRAALRVGVQRNAEVTVDGAGHDVTQVFCSALPVAYNSALPARSFESFARLVLEAAYEATLCAALVTARQTGNRTLYLTQLGGGVFGNETAWIIDAMERAMGCFDDVDLDLAVVSHRRSDPAVGQMVERHGRSL